MFSRTISPFASSRSDAPMDSAYSPVPELNLLSELEKSLGGEFISDGFEMLEFGEPQHDSWSDAPEFVEAFLPFAAATGSGSFYALWRVDDRADLAALPIAAFGDEGGIHLTARDLRDLFRQLASDRPLSVDWGDAYFAEYEGYHRERDGAPEAHAAYVAWLKQHFGLDPVSDPNDLIKAARDEFGARFETWLKPFI
ncbi:hypothetical protein ACFFWA_27815 [Actinomadura verrucosospora]|uniref:hypothetical protein n=1 Tax=Actinomadura verrucosospora TaxID=46165 RepID=UPI0031EACE4F